MPEPELLVNTVPRDEVWNHWEWLQPWIERATEREVNGVETNSILADALNGGTIILVISEKQGSQVSIKAVSVMQLAPQALHLQTLTGEDREQWWRLYCDSVEKIARNLGKRFVTSMSRKGMVPLMEQEQFSTHSHYLVRELT